ncbi:hypothetical protein BG004_007460 [Podila humilis]|nr:hypothetical protein BG004_007460 [Podila humilis]
MATSLTTAISTYTPSVKYDLVSFPPGDRLPPSNDASRRARSGTTTSVPGNSSKRCFSMILNPSTLTKSNTSSDNHSASDASGLDQKARHHHPHRAASGTVTIPWPHRHRQHRTTYGHNFPALSPIKGYTQHQHQSQRQHHKKTHSIQIATKVVETLKSPLVHSPLQQSHVFDWDTVHAQDKEMETKPVSPSSCASCGDYVYMAPCEHHPSKGQTEYLINDMLPKLTHDLSTIEFGIRVSDFMPLAFKTVPVAGLAEKELHLLDDLRDLPNVIHLEDSFVNDSGDTVLVLPMLKTFDCQAVNSSLCTVRRSMQQILTGLSAVHAKSIVHLDINPSNLMTTHDKKDLVIIDFGLSMTIDRSGEDVDIPVCGTTGYIAPEVMRRDHYRRHDPTLADIYSVGIVLGQMLEPYVPDCDLHYFGSKYLSTENTNQTVVHLKEFIAQGTCYPRVLIQAVDLLCIMLEEDPINRKSAKELLATHQFLATPSTPTTGDSTLKLCDWLCRVQEIKYQRYLYDERSGCDIVRYR